MEQYKQEFIEFMMSADVLRFGEFITKSGRKTPYFARGGGGLEESAEGAGVMEETLLSVGIDTGAASPQTGQPVWGPHVMFASSAEVNSVCGKSPRCVDFTGIRPPRRAGARWWRCRNE